MTYKIVPNTKEGFYVISLRPNIPKGLDTQRSLALTYVIRTPIVAWKVRVSDGTAYPVTILGGMVNEPVLDPNNKVTIPGRSDCVCLETWFQREVEKREGAKEPVVGPANLLPEA